MHSAKKFRDALFMQLPDQLSEHRLQDHVFSDSPDKPRQPWSDYSEKNSTTSKKGYQINEHSPDKPKTKPHSKHSPQHRRIKTPTFRSTAAPKAMSEPQTSIQVHRKASPRPRVHQPARPTTGESKASQKNSKKHAKDVTRLPIFSKTRNLCKQRDVEWKKIKFLE